MVETRYQVVFMTASNPEEADKIAESLVEEGLAACVNIVASCRSVYKWKGDLVKDDEVLLVAKTKCSHFNAIEKRVLELHSYDVPEIIAMDLTSIAEGYRSFLGDLLGE